MRLIHVAAACSLLLAVVGLALLLEGGAELPLGTPARATGGESGATEAPVAPPDHEAHSAAQGAALDTPELTPSAEGASEAVAPSVWYDVRTIAGSWWVNCRSGPIGKVGRTLERSRFVVADPSAPAAERERAGRVVRQLEQLEGDWDIQLCGWISEE